VPLDQLPKYINNQRFDESDYLLDLRRSNCRILEKICIRLKTLKELRKNHQFSSKAMLASIQQHTGNVEFCWDAYKSHSAVIHKEDDTNASSQQSSDMITREMVGKRKAYSKAGTSTVAPVKTRTMGRKEKAATMKASVTKSQFAEPLHVDVLSPDEIDGKIDQVMKKIQHRFEKLEQYFHFLKLLIDTKEKAIEQSIQADEDSIHEKKQYIREYENLIYQKQLIREDESSIREKKRSRDQFLQTTEVFLEEANCKYQCVGGALRRARISTIVTNPDRNVAAINGSPVAGQDDRE
jgi:hypothetical protein